MIQNGRCNIPKKIHYCWFGRKPLPAQAQKCIASWQKYCPDFEIIEWNEDNFNIEANEYVREAYQNKKWAFVSDYVRLHALYHMGGIYLDTDVELLNNMEGFLENKGFCGFEDTDTVATAIIGTQKKSEVIKALLKEYDEKAFVKPDGNMDLTPNVVAMTKYFVAHGLKLNNALQEINDFKVYPRTYFCPKDHLTRKVELTAHTYAIHHFDGSWLSKSAKLKIYIAKGMGPKLTQYMTQIKRQLRGGSV